MQLQNNVKVFDGELFVFLGFFLLFVGLFRLFGNRVLFGSNLFVRNHLTLSVT